MTQVAERPAGMSLNNPVPGAWIQLADRDLPPVYVPFEAQYRKNEATGKDELIGHAPGAHIKRLLSEGAMYANMPSATTAPLPAPSATEADLRAQLAAAEMERERYMAELKELREKMASDPHVPNSPKRTR